MDEYDLDAMYPSPNVKAADLDGRDVKVTISAVNIEEVGRERERKPVLYFEHTLKPLICNKTNARTIAKIHGSANARDWVGKEITLYEATTTDPRGDVVACIRVRIPSVPRRAAAPPT